MREHVDVQPQASSIPGPLALIFGIMPDHPKTVFEIQEECRRFAAETDDTDVSQILAQAADDLEQIVRKTRSEAVPTKH
jgi:hypothetical protein